MAMGTVVTRRPAARSRLIRCVWRGAPLGPGDRRDPSPRCAEPDQAVAGPPKGLKATIVTNRPNVRSQRGRPGEHPMHYGTVVTPGRGARTDTHAREPPSPGGVTCDSVVRMWPCLFRSRATPNISTNDHKAELRPIAIATSRSPRSQPAESTSSGRAVGLLTTPVRTRRWGTTAPAQPSAFLLRCPRWLRFPRTFVRKSAR